MKFILVIAAIVAGVAGISAFANKSTDNAKVVLKSRVHTIDQAIDEVTK